MRNIWLKRWVKQQNLLFSGFIWDALQKAVPVTSAHPVSPTDTAWYPSGGMLVTAAHHSSPPGQICYLRHSNQSKESPEFYRTDRRSDVQSGEVWPPQVLSQNQGIVWKGRTILETGCVMKRQGNQSRSQTDCLPHFTDEESRCGNCSQVPWLAGSKTWD